MRVRAFSVAIFVFFMLFATVFAFSFSVNSPFSISSDAKVFASDEPNNDDFVIDSGERGFPIAGFIIYSQGSNSSTATYNASSGLTYYVQNLTFTDSSLPIETRWFQWYFKPSAEGEYQAIKGAGGVFTAVSQTDYLIRNVSDSGWYRCVVRVRLITGQEGWWDYERIATINPLQINAEWTAVSDKLEFNGELQAPEPHRVFDRNANYNVPFTVRESSKAINVNPLTARYTAVVESNDSNYAIISHTFQYDITPKPVTVIWDKTEFVYDGTPHHPTATAKDIFGNDLPLTYVDYEVSGQHINARPDPYFIIVACHDSNYNIGVVASIGNRNGAYFTIIPFVIDYEWIIVSECEIGCDSYANTHVSACRKGTGFIDEDGNANIHFNGKKQWPSAVPAFSKIPPAYHALLEGITFEIRINQEPTYALNVGDYVVNIDGTSNIDAQLRNNFALSASVGDFKIIPRDTEVFWKRFVSDSAFITLEIDSEGKAIWPEDRRPVYSGGEQRIFAYFIDINGSVRSMQTTIGITNARQLPYEISANLLPEDSNYSVSGAEFRTVFIVMERATPTVSVDSSALVHTYRGEPYYLPAVISQSGAVSLFVNGVARQMSYAFNSPGTYLIRIETALTDNYNQAFWPSAQNPTQTRTLTLYGTHFESHENEITLEYYPGADASLKPEIKDIKEEGLSGYTIPLSKTILAVYEIVLTDGYSEHRLTGEANVKIKVESRYLSRNTLRIITLKDGAHIEQIITVDKDGFAEFTLYESGAYAIVAVNGGFVSAWWFVAVGALVLIVIAVIIGWRRSTRYYKRLY
ncbi:MAG: hypothetical protein FWD49_07890 [Firmicutes bacterium]|nr:hypothetical protein [Bacillota bacterium]